MKNKFTIMKKMCFAFAFCCLSIFNVLAQVVDVITGVEDATGLALDGDNLYISNYTFGQILVSDISQPNPTTSVIASGINGNSTGIILIGNDLFVAQETGQILKFDISQSNPVPTTVTTGLWGIRIKYL